ncbi:molybdenum cofactor guanylyltransferase [Salinispirillum sp. LH 10-3-1]|uniref:Molybdenum cofactor guanylyltransferase n=1 Tax=Salinispirillum sp. LH 10-3-1 TaxID=2952525 RepID=A0AB38YIK9_9GAMM
MAPCVGIVLAGGRSSRMGRDKAGLLWHTGVTWAEHARQRLLSVCDDVHVSHADDLADLRSDFIGPLGGIESALTACMGRRCVFLPVDMPRVDESDLRVVTEVAEPHATYAQGWFPLMLTATPDVLATVQSILALPEARQRSVRALVEALQPNISIIDAAAPDRLKNINDPVELQAMGLGENTHG